MVTTAVKVEKYPRFAYDEDADEQRGEFEGWTVFSTIQIGEGTFVRAIVENRSGTPADSGIPDWHVVWHLPKRRVSCPLTDHMDQAKAIEIARAAAAVLANNIDRMPTASSDAATFLADLAKTIPGSLWREA